MKKREIARIIEGRMGYPKDTVDVKMITEIPPDKDLDKMPITPKNVYAVRVGGVIIVVLYFNDNNVKLNCIPEV